MNSRRFQVVFAPLLGVLLFLSSIAAHADVIIVKNESFPRTDKARITKRVKIERAYSRRRLFYRLDCEGDYLRYFRIYVNGKQVFTRLVRTSVRGWIDLSAHLPRAGWYTIMYENNAVHQSWRLDSKLQGASGTVTSWSKWRKKSGAPLPSVSRQR